MQPVATSLDSPEFRIKIQSQTLLMNQQSSNQRPNSPKGAALPLAQPEELATLGWVRTIISYKSEEPRDPAVTAAKECSRKFNSVHFFSIATALPSPLL